MPNLGAAFGQGWEDYLTKQAENKRNAMLDDLKRQSEARLLQEGIDRHQEHMTLMQEHDQKARDDAENRITKRLQDTVTSFNLQANDVPSQEMIDAVEKIQPGASKTIFRQGTNEVVPGPTEDAKPLTQVGPTRYPGSVKQQDTAARALRLQGYANDPTTLPHVRDFILASHAASMDDDFTIPATLFQPKEETRTSGGHWVNPKTKNQVYEKNGVSYDSVTNEMVPNPEPGPMSPDQKAQNANAAGARADAAVDRQEKNNIDREDKSYQFQTARIDKVVSPIFSSIQRMGRLTDTLDQNNFQSDALISPELMITMAGGTGTGLRINDTEIQRVAGGHTQMIALKQWMAQWSPNADNAQIPKEQRAQIYKLMDAVKVKLRQKNEAINGARTAIRTGTVDEQRKAADDLEARLVEIDDTDTDTGKKGGEVKGAGPGGSGLTVYDVLRQRQAEKAAAAAAAAGKKP